MPAVSHRHLNIVHLSSPTASSVGFNYALADCSPTQTAVSPATSAPPTDAPVSARVPVVLQARSPAHTRSRRPPASRGAIPLRLTNLPPAAPPSPSALDPEPAHA